MLGGCHVKPEQMFNLIFGYNAIWDENLGGIATGTTYSKYTSTVPAGELWVLNALSVQNNTRAPTYTVLQLERANGVIASLAFAASLVRYQPLLGTGAFILGAGDKARAYMEGTQNGDEIFGGVAGYKMKLSQ